MHTSFVQVSLLSQIEKLFSKVFYLELLNFCFVNINFPNAVSIRVKYTETVSRYGNIREEVHNILLSSFLGGFPSIPVIWAGKVTCDTEGRKSKREQN